MDVLMLLSHMSLRLSVLELEKLNYFLCSSTFFFVWLRLSLKSVSDWGDELL